jgi:hypothetical protein
MNVAHLVYHAKFQRNGIANVNKFFLIDLITTNTSNPHMDEFPSI